MDEQKIIVTLSGKDQVGIVMKITTVLAEYGVNIEDIKQTLMQGQFVMFLLGDISNSKNTFKEIKQALLDKAEEMGMEIWIQKKEIFDKMHNI
ncbi:ACT domain-containing protein [bacterium]|nr:ACT domain-containing protein [bacterium]